MGSIYGIENPLMDVIFSVGYDVVRRTGAVPGSMNLVDIERRSSVLAACVGSEMTRIPGGSAANTMKGIAWLRGDDSSVDAPRYSGGIGDDEFGEQFESMLRTLGVETALPRKPSPTGVSVILVTPDYERTMFTYLGACREYGPEDVRFDDVLESEWLYTTGFMWDTENQKRAVRTLLREVKAAGKRVAFDVADPFVVQRYGDELRSNLIGNIDVLFGNREELSMLTGVRGDDEAIISAAERYAPIVAMKTGKDGCVILDNGAIESIPGELVVPKDTTGAGDSFASGFLFGMLKRRPLSWCGRLANRVASRIVTVEGCDFTRLDRDEILEGFLVG